MKKNLAVILLMASCTFAVAQDLQAVQSDSATVLTFGEAIKIGVQNNVILNTQKNQLYATQARRSAAIANFLPNLSASAFAQRSDGLQIDPTTGNAVNATSDLVSGSINSNLVLFNGLGRINNLQANNKSFQAQAALVKRSKQDVVFTVASQYLQVLLDQELLKIAAQNLEVQKITFEQIKGFVETGSRAQADLYTQDALMQNANVTYLRAKITLENDRALLAQTLQLDPSIPFTVKQPELEGNVDTFRRLSLDSLNNIALSYREDLKQQNYLVEANQRFMRAAIAGYLPTVGLFASYGSQYYANNSWEIFDDPELKQPSFGTQFRDLNPSLSYGISLNIPLFDRFVTRTNRVTARVAYDNAKLTRDNLAKTIKIDVQRAVKNYETAIESYQASLVQFEAGQLAFQTQQESYRLGVSSQVVLAAAQQTFTQAAASKAQAEVTLVFQEVLLQYALGTLKVEDLYDGN
jgi:outer membrane protein